MRCILACIVLIVGISNVRAQQNPIFSQYIFNGLAINPAYAGSHVQMSLTAQYRNQWVNFDGAPRTFSVSGHTSLLKQKIGVGAMITNDQIGSYRNQSIFGSYSYIIKTPAGKLALGLQAGFNVVSADFSDLNLFDPGDVSFGGINNRFRPNFGAGAYFHNKHFFAGFSVPFLLNNSLTADGIESALGEIREARHYFLHGGLLLPMSRAREVIFNPTVLLRAQEGSPLSLDINAGFIFYEVFSIGASYRNIDAVVTYLDLKISDQLHFGYSYDWTTSDINQFSNGTHEFTLNYRFRIRQVHGNAECPTYFQYQ